MKSEGTAVIEVTPDGQPKVPNIGFKRSIAIPLGLFLLATSYQIFGQQTDVRMEAGLLVGNLVACAAWVFQLRSGRIRWWATGLLGGGASLLVTPAFHVALGGAPELAANVAAGLGAEAGAFVAVVTGAGLHALSYGFGWGQRDDAGSDRCDGSHQADPMGRAEDSHGRPADVNVADPK